MITLKRQTSFHRLDAISPRPNQNLMREPVEMTDHQVTLFVGSLMVTDINGSADGRVIRRWKTTTSSFFPISFMATRSFIARKTEDGFEGAYCHWGGAPNENGAILLEHYSDPGKVAELLSHGDMSSLGTTVGQKHSFDVREPEATTYYGRDRGENGPQIGVKRYSSLSELLSYAERCGCEFLYLFDNEWKFVARRPQYFGFSDGSHFSRFRKLG